MNSYDIVLTKQAEEDLSNVYEYIAYKLHEEYNAKKQIDRIKNAIFELDSMPERYKAYEKGVWKKRNTHYFSVDNYTIFYTVDSKTETVYVIRVIYSKRNIDKQMSKQINYK